MCGALDSLVSFADAIAYTVRKISIKGFLYGI